MASHVRESGHDLNPWNGPEQVVISCRERHRKPASCERACKAAGVVGDTAATALFNDQDTAPV